MPFYCGKRFAGICVVLAQKKSSTYSSEYACGFFGAAASHLPASHFPRNERLLGQAPRKTRNGLGSFEPPKLKTAMSNRMKYGRSFSIGSRMLPKTMQSCSWYKVADVAFVPSQKVISMADNSATSLCHVLLGGCCADLCAVPLPHGKSRNDTGCNAGHRRVTGDRLSFCAISKALRASTQQVCSLLIASL